MVELNQEVSERSNSASNQITKINKVCGSSNGCINEVGGLQNNIDGEHFMTH
jgi:hypothetical protein